MEGAQTKHGEPERQPRLVERKEDFEELFRVFVVLPARIPEDLQRRRWQRSCGGQEGGLIGRC